MFVGLIMSCSIGAYTYTWNSREPAGRVGRTLKAGSLDLLIAQAVRAGRCDLHLHRAGMLGMQVTVMC